MAIDFLKRIGRHITKAEEVKKGDIVAGIGYYKFDIRIYCVDSIRIGWEPKCLARFPEVYLKPPHVGLTIVDDKVSGCYIHTPMPGSSYLHSWMQCTKEELGDDELEVEIYKDSIFDLYLIEDEEYKRLGNLINDVTVPYWGVMGQTLRGQNYKGLQPIYDFVATVKPKLDQARKLYEEIKNDERRASM